MNNLWKTVMGMDPRIVKFATEVSKLLTDLSSDEIEIKVKAVSDGIFDTDQEIKQLKRDIVRIDEELKLLSKASKGKKTK